MGEPRITAEIPVPRDTYNLGVAVGAGSAWVGLEPRERSGEDSIIRIDLATNEIVAEIPVAAAPSRKRIAATADVVWVGSTGLLERIDPATNAIVASVAIPDRSISAIVVDDAAVWAVTIDRSAQGFLVRVDPATNKIVAEIPSSAPRVFAGYEDEVQLGAGSVWVLGVRWFEREDAEYGSDLIRIDPATNTMSEGPGGGFHMAVGTDEVWVRFPADGIFGCCLRWRTRRAVGLDPRGRPTNEPSKPFRFGTTGCSS